MSVLFIHPGRWRVWPWVYKVDKQEVKRAMCQIRNVYCITKFKLCQTYICFKCHFKERYFKNVYLSLLRIFRTFERGSVGGSSEHFNILHRDRLTLNFI